MQDSISEISKEEINQQPFSSQEELHELLQQNEKTIQKEKAEKTRLSHEQRSSHDQVNPLSTYEKDLFDVSNNFTGTNFKERGIPLLNKIESFLNQPEVNLKDLNFCRQALAQLKADLLEKATLSQEKKNSFQNQIESFDQKALELITSLETASDSLLDCSQEKTLGFEKVNLCHKLLTEVGIPKLNDLEKELKNLANQVETINSQREELLVLKKELSQEFDKKNQKFTLSDQAMELIHSLNQKGIALINLKENQKDLSLEQYTELKEQISSQTSNLQLQQQTKFSTEINPLLTEKTIIMETLKAILRYDTRTHEAFVHNQKVNG